MRKTAVVVGAGSGIGLGVVQYLSRLEFDIVAIDRNIDDIPQSSNIVCERFNLLNKDFSLFEKYKNADALFVTAGFGRLALFSDLEEQEIVNELTVNTLAVMKLVKIFYNKLSGKDDFFCGIMGSIAGYLNSPMFSVYSASKAAVCRFCESVNSELEYMGSPNRILNASPAAMSGTKFSGASNTDLSQIENFVAQFVQKTFARELLFIPDYEKTFKPLILQNINQTQQFGLESIQYKKNQGRLDKPTKPQLTVGYLSGTFDLFHMGHLNLIRRAKQYCDYLVVGVHKDASHKGKVTYESFEARLAKVAAISYVDKAIESIQDDGEVYKTGLVKYDYLFVGSDYQGTERFRRYEEYFADKGVKIIYFPYTSGVSSTEIRRKMRDDTGDKK